MSHTPGPLYTTPLLVDEYGNEYVGIGPYELEPPQDHHYEDTIAEVYHGNGNDAVANARLFAAASDHALVASALASGIARWEAWGQSGKGELCFGGFRYSTQLDDFGVPIVHDGMRRPLHNALSRATGSQEANNDPATT